MPKNTFYAPKLINLVTQAEAAEVIYVHPLTTYDGLILDVLCSRWGSSSLFSDSVCSSRCSVWICRTGRTGLVMGLTGVVLARSGRVRWGGDCVGAGVDGVSMTWSDGGIRRPAVERYSVLNLEAKSSCKPTKRPLTTRNSSRRPIVISRSPWKSSSKSLVEGDDDGVPGVLFEDME